VLCAKYSLCLFSGNTIKGSSGYGVAVSSSQSGLSGDTLDPDSIVVQGNSDGIAVGCHGTLIMTNSTVQANFNVGMRAVAGSGAHPLKTSLVASDISDAPTSGSSSACG
jgi:hypothetical protein